jgi:death-on-curing protein
MVDSVWYPSVTDIVAIHDDIVLEYSDTHRGMRNRGDIEFALNYIEHGSFGTKPETIHEKTFHLLRLLVANHPFVDANKRTALNTTVVFYFFNEYHFAYDAEIRTILKRFGTDETTVDQHETISNLRSHTDQLDLAGEIEVWRDDHIQNGIEQLASDSADPNNNDLQRNSSPMSTGDTAEFSSPLDKVMSDNHRELVRQVAAADRDSNREIYDALEHE